MCEIDLITNNCSLASIKDEDDDEVDFSDQGLKLDSKDDAQEIVSAIKNCYNMKKLKLEGSTIGVEAAKAIGEALEMRPTLKNVLWKDMFTQRTELEIPVALTYLSSGIMMAGARLVELDLSDNAFGPRGLKGVLNLLQSRSCFTLRELRLNNNGLGITGGALLSEALNLCLINSRKEGTPLRLKVFICGRNRLEDEGTRALSEFIKSVETLEHVSVPQNGIYHDGISCLSEALSTNTSLKILNLEDNTLTETGAKAIAKELEKWTELEVLNLSDCLVRTEGTKLLASALKKSAPDLKELLLGYNEIHSDGGKAIMDAIIHKIHLEKLVLNGNNFGSQCCEFMKQFMEATGKINILESLSDDESSANEDSDDDNKPEGSSKLSNVSKDQEDGNTSHMENNLETVQGTKISNWLHEDKIAEISIAESSANEDIVDNNKLEGNSELGNSKEDPQSKGQEDDNASYMENNTETVQDTKISNQLHEDKIVEIEKLEIVCDNEGEKIELKDCNQQTADYALRTEPSKSVETSDDDLMMLQEFKNNEASNVECDIRSLEVMLEKLPLCDNYNDNLVQEIPETNGNATEQIGNPFLLCHNGNIGYCEVNEEAKNGHYNGANETESTMSNNLNDHHHINGNDRDIIMDSCLLGYFPFRDFIINPSRDKLIELFRSGGILRGLPEIFDPVTYFEWFLKVSSVIYPEDEDVYMAAYQSTDMILGTAFKNWPEENMWKFNNDFLVTLGLIKGEDKKVRDVENKVGISILLEHALKQKYFHNSTKELLKFFLKK